MISYEVYLLKSGDQQNHTALLETLELMLDVEFYDSQNPWRDDSIARANSAESDENFVLEKHYNDYANLWHFPEDSDYDTMLSVNNSPRAHELRHKLLEKLEPYDIKLKSSRSYLDAL